MIEGKAGEERERESSRDYIHNRARVLKGPGIAVRAPPGTNYRVYGLVVISSESQANNTTCKETHTVYVSLPDAEKTTIAGNTLSPTSTDLLISTSSGGVGVNSSNHNHNNNNSNSNSGGGISTLDGIRTVREYDRLVNSVLTLPLGDSLEERNSVRGYTWSGTVPFHLRPFLWRLLCGHIPCAPASLSRQQAELRRKREEYDNFVAKYYKISITDFMQTSTTIQSGGGGSFSRLQEREQEEMLISNQSSSYMNMNSTTSTNSTRSRSGSTSAARTEEEASKSARRKRKMMMMITPDEQAILSQIALDLPRHTHALFHHPETASALARCLFLWSRRFPAVGYVQGIDDIMVVFFFVFLSGAINERNIELGRNERDPNKDNTSDGNTRKENSSSSINSTSITNNNTTTTINKGKENQWISASVVFTRDVNELDAALQHLSEDLFRAAEADTYFCGGFFLSWLQDNFVQGQSGIIRSISLVEKVLEKSDPDILTSITSQGITLVDCCFQWVHCLLAREFPLEMIVLLWEKYLAMGNSETVIDFHAYVCAALLMQLRDKLLGKSVDVVIQLLKDPLGVRVKQQKEQQKEKEQQQLVGGNDNKYDRRWLEELISRASKLFREYPMASLT